VSAGILVLVALSLSSGWQVGGQVARPLTERYDLERRSVRWVLPGRLDEVSGLAFTADDRMFAHDDERATLYAIDPSTGSVGRGFDVGPTGPVRDDFEGLAIVGERWFLVSSRGILYEFREAPEGGSAPVRVTDTGLGAGCEVEGLAHDARAGALLLACKNVAPRADVVRVHRLSLDPDATPLPPLRVPFSALAGAGLTGGFHPSGIDVDPSTGSLVLVAAAEEALVELAPDGRVLSVLHLSRGRHPQPEGIAFGPDRRLWIADEAHGRDARLTAYDPRRVEGTPWPGG
jgi:uncharacterized protein YjiK